MSIHREIDVLSLCSEPHLGRALEEVLALRGYTFSDIYFFTEGHHDYPYLSHSLGTDRNLWLV